MADLDTPHGCVAELATCNREIAEFGYQWATDAGELKTLTKRYDRLYKAALRSTTGKNADERVATANAAVEAVDEGISERIEDLIGNVERCKRLFDTLERRSSNAQSILTYHRETAKLDSYVGIVNLGNPAENRTARILEGFGYLVGSRRHIGGAGDLLAIRGWREPPLLIEVKRGTGSPWEHFRGEDRALMILTAIDFRLMPLLAYWPWHPGGLNKHPIWLPLEDWP